MPLDAGNRQHRNTVPNVPTRCPHRRAGDCVARGSPADRPPSGTPTAPRGRPSCGCGPRGAPRGATPPARRGAGGPARPAAGKVCRVQRERFRCLNASGGATSQSARKSAGGANRSMTTTNAVATSAGNHRTYPIPEPIPARTVCGHAAWHMGAGRLLVGNLLSRAPGTTATNTEAGHTSVARPMRSRTSAGNRPGEPSPGLRLDGKDGSTMKNQQITCWQKQQTSGLHWGSIRKP